MSKITNSNCPLCQSEAHCEEHFAKRLKHILCPVCKDVVIKNMAERHVIDSTEQTRQHFSDYCTKVPDGKVTFLAHEPNGHGVAPTILAEYLTLREALAR